MKQRTLQFVRHSIASNRRALLLTVLLLAVSKLAAAQAFWAEAGTSTMFRASGFEVNYKWAPFQGWASASWSEGFHVGGFVQTRIKDLNVGVGDWYQPLVIDTDVFDQSRYFAGRGISVQHGQSTRKVVFFAGSTSNENSSTFYRTFQPEKGVGGVFLEDKVGRSWTFHSMNLVQDSVTSIQSVRYQASDMLDFSAAGGVGNNSGYFSLGTRYRQRDWQVVGSYTSVGDTFQRVTGVLNNAPERVGANVHFNYQPRRNLQIALGHDNLLSPTLVSEDKAQRVSLDSVNVAWELKGFRLGSGLSYSKSGDLTAQTQNFGVSRNLSANIMASGTLMRIDNNTQPTTILIGSVQEKITPRLTLNQGISAQAGTHTMTWGARWIGNQFTIGFQQDMLYTPLAGGFKGKPYTNIWTINLMTRLPRSLRLHANSFVDSSGRVRYTSWVDGIGLARSGEMVPRGTPVNVNFSRFVVVGQVQDEQGRPVWGIAVQVDGQTAFTDNAGRFFLRFRKGLTYPVAVLPERGLNPQYYEVVQAPVSATAETEDMASRILIVVRQAKAPVKLKSENEPAHTTDIATATGPMNQ